MTTSLRNQITSYAQCEDDSLYKAWESLKDLLRLCHHYDLPNWMIVQAFYNGVTYAMRFMIDAAIGGTLINKTVDEAYNLIEEMVLNNYQCSNERTPSKKARGID